MELSKREKKFAKLVNNVTIQFMKIVEAKIAKLEKKIVWSQLRVTYESEENISIISIIDIKTDITLVVIDLNEIPNGNIHDDCWIKYLSGQACILIKILLSGKYPCPPEKPKRIFGEIWFKPPCGSKCKDVPVKDPCKEKNNKHGHNHDYDSSDNEEESRSGCSGCGNRDRSRCGCAGFNGCPGANIGTKQIFYDKCSGKEICFDPNKRNKLQFIEKPYIVQGISVGDRPECSISCGRKREDNCGCGGGLQGNSNCVNCGNTGSNNSKKYCIKTYIDWEAKEKICTQEVKKHITIISPVQKEVACPINCDRIVEIPQRPKHKECRISCLDEAPNCIDTKFF